jgi:tripartite-type tricarboxylate transporter receptor subunit TctC
MNAEPMRPINVSSKLARAPARAAISIDVHQHFNPTLAEAGPEMKPKLANVGGELMTVPAEKVDAIVKADYDKWLKIIKDAGISLD